MRIIIPRITETTTQQDLEDFVGQALKYWGVFTYIAKSSIYDYRILAVDDGQDGLIYHGLIDVKDKKVASRLIRKLNGKRLNNEKVEVRLFVNRHAWSGLYLVENERRRMNMALM